MVTFGAFVEIMPGVEGLVHISELAQHHVENPREIVSQGDLVEAKIIEVDAERRRLSLSLKRVDEDGEGTHGELGLSEEVFSTSDEAPAAPEAEAAEVAEPEAEAAPEEPAAEAEAAPPADEAEATPEPAADEADQV